MQAARYTNLPFGFITTELDFSHYRDVGGIKFPFRITKTWFDVRSVIELKSVDTHVHRVVDDLNATLARLKQNGMPVTANDARTPGSVTGASFSAPSQVYAAYVSDPDNIRLELNQWVDSLPKRAAEAWK